MRHVVVPSVLLACADPVPTGPDTLPAALHVEATAEQRFDDGHTVTCALDYVVELEASSERSSDDVTTWDGTLGGEAQRFVLDDEGAGFGFRADAFGEAEIRLERPVDLAIAVPINLTATDTPFWYEQAAFRGTADADGHVTGTWTCAPLNLDDGGYEDLEHEVEGTWTGTPLDLEPVEDTSGT